MVVPYRRQKSAAAKRRSANVLRSAESLERRLAMTASIGLDAVGVLNIVGTSGNDMVEVAYVDTTRVVNGALETTVDTSKIVVRGLSDTGSSVVTGTFDASAITSVRYAGGGGNDFLANSTTKATAWSTTTTGSVSTSLMVGSPGYRVTGAANEVGIFRVGPTGQVGIDYLFRGAGYAGQLAIFSLKGMEAFQPGSNAYMKEAIRRALSQSTLGHVAIKVAEQGAKFSATLPWEGNMNKGTYKGVQTFTMDPGDSFAAFIVPSGTVQEIAHVTSYPSTKRPLFSVPAANPYPVGPQFLGQVGDLTGQGNVFAFEDLRLDGSSDRDYNDLVFQVTGARGQATPVSEVTNVSRNMAMTGIFQQQVNPYVAAQAQADDVAMAAGLLEGGFVAGESGRVSVTTSPGSRPGEVAIFSLQGMSYLTPGSPEFIREAARRALTGSTLGHIVSSSHFDAESRGPRAMTPGDSFGILAVEEGSIWGLFTGATKASGNGVHLSVPGVAQATTTISATTPSEDSAPLWSLGLGGLQVTVGGASSANMESVTTGLANLCTVVYLDLANDGIADPADPGVAGAVVKLSGIDAAGRSFTQTVVSEATGCAEFVGVPAGIYRISVSDPSGRTLVAGSQVGSGAGRAIDGSITGVVLRPGDDAKGYAIGRVIPARLEGSVYHDRNLDRVFDSTDSGIQGVTLNLTGTDDRGMSVTATTKTDSKGGYKFAGLRPGMYAVSQVQPAGWLNARSTIGNFATQPHPISRNGVVARNVFSAIGLMPGERGTNYNFGETLAKTEMTDVEVERVFQGTTGDDQVEIRLGTDFHAVTINGVMQQVDASVATIMSFNGLGGDDAVVIHGIPGRNRMTIARNVSSLQASGIWVEANGVADVTFHGGIGDRTFVYDTPGDDLFTADAKTAVLTGAGFRGTAIGVERVYAYAASGGSDRAVLTGSTGRDSFIATPGDARMYGDAYYNFVRGFATVEGVGVGGGDDRAYLYDSEGDDTFAADPGIARLTGPGFELVARSFPKVDAYATSGGIDRATFTGSVGDDRFFADPLGGRMVGTGFDYRGTTFEVLVGMASGGYDRAYLTGTHGDDTLTASPSRSRLTGPGLDATAESFQWVSVVGGSCLGSDLANLTIDGGDNVIEATETGIRLRGLNYSIRVDNFTLVNAFASAGTNRKNVSKAPFAVVTHGDWVS